MSPGILFRGGLRDRPITPNGLRDGAITSINRCDGAIALNHLWGGWRI